MEGDCDGVQLGIFVNYAGGRLRGLQLSGLTAYADDGSAAQLAPILAQAKRLRGFQFGLVTLAQDEFGFLDGRGNDNGILDVGDLRAHLRFLGTLPGDTASVQGGTAR